jgi:hypothetical protein
MATKNESPIKSVEKRPLTLELDYTCEVCGKGAPNPLCRECLDEIMEELWGEGRLVWNGVKNGQDSFLHRTFATSDEVRASIAERQRRNLPVAIKTRYEIAKSVCKTLYGDLLNGDRLLRALDGDEPEENLSEMDFGAIPDDPLVTEDTTVVLKEAGVVGLTTDRIVDAVFVRQGGVLDASRTSVA